MKLALIAALPPGCEPESEHALRLAEALAAGGAEVRALSGRGCADPGIPGLTVEPRMRDWTWRDLPRLASFLRKSRPDALLLHYLGWVYGEHPMVTMAPALARALVPGVRTVTCLTGCSGASLYSWLRPAGTRTRKLPAAGAAAGAGPVRRTDAVHGGGRIPRLMRALSLGRLDGRFGSILEASDRIVVMSEAQRAAFAAYAPGAAGRLAIVPPGPAVRALPAPTPDERRRWRESLGAGPGDFLFVHFGFVYPGKGLETLLRAMKLLTADRPEARLAVAGGVHPTAGPAHLGAMRELAAGLGIAGRVAWTGGYDWNSPAPSEWLRAADACVLPFDAGLQLNNSSFAAAAAHALPVISTRGPGSGAPFADGENVRLCPPGSPEALAGAMRELAGDAALRERLADGALRLAGDVLSWPAIARRFLELLAGK
ncbi:MAG TPA: glycosyltransferase [Planctomycetota bacterium]|nr:glycosyltransferase [Planctomycetota bacterium]